MGVDTYAFIKSNSNDIYSYVKRNFDSKAKIEETAFKDSPSMYTIYFDFGDENRILHIHDMQFGGIYVDKEEEWYYEKYQAKEESSSYMYHKEGVPDNTPGVICSLGCWGSSVLIFDLLSVEFGGWIDENDCDDEDFRKGATSKRNLIKVIFKKYKFK